MFIMARAEEQLSRINVTKMIPCGASVHTWLKIYHLELGSVGCSYNRAQKWVLEHGFVRLHVAVTALHVPQCAERSNVQPLIVEIILSSPIVALPRPPSLATKCSFSYQIL